MGIISRDIVELGMEGVDELVRGYRRAKQAQDDFARGARDAGAGVGAAERGVKALTSSFTEMNSALSLAGKGLSVFRKAAEAASKPLNLAVSFEAAFGQIRTLTDEANADLEADLRDLAKRVPQTISDVALAGYQAISASQKPKDVVKFLEDASGLAVAGNTSLTASVDLLTTAVNAYEQQGLSSKRAGDVLFQTVRQGKTNVEELTASFGLAAPTAASYGVEIEELGAAIATLTKSGVQTPIALTQINALMTQIAKPSATARKEFERLGIAYGVTALRGKGLSGVLREIQDKTLGNVDAQNKLFDNVRATRGLFKLLAGDLETFDGDLEAIRASQGQVARGNAIMAETTQGAINRFQSLFEGLLVEAGRSVLPLLNRNIETLTATLSERGPQIVENLARILELMVKIGAFVVDAGGTVIKFFDDMASSIDGAVGQVTVQIEETEAALREQLLAAGIEVRQEFSLMSQEVSLFARALEDVKSQSAGLVLVGNAVRSAQSFVSGLTPVADIKRAFKVAKAELRDLRASFFDTGKSGKSPARGAGRKQAQDFFEGLLEGASAFGEQAAQRLSEAYLSTPGLDGLIAARAADADRLAQIQQDSLDAQLAAIDARAPQEFARAARAGEDLVLLQREFEARRQAVIDEFAARRRQAQEQEAQAALANAERAAGLDPTDLDRQFAALEARHAIEVEAARRRGEDITLIEQEHAQRRYEVEVEVAERRRQLWVGAAESFLGTMEQITATVVTLGGKVGALDKARAAIRVGIEGAESVSAAGKAAVAYGAGDLFAAGKFALGAIKHAFAAIQFAKAAGKGGGAAAGAGGGGVGGGTPAVRQGRDREPVPAREGAGKTEITYNISVSSGFGTKDELMDGVIKGISGAHRRIGGGRLDLVALGVR